MNAAVPKRRRARVEMGARAAPIVVGVALAIATAAIAPAASGAQTRDGKPDEQHASQGGMDMQQGGMPSSAARAPVPLVRGFYNGKTIFFIHTEASDPKVAKLLTRMMRSPVLLVPKLARVPRSALASVFVFTNGVRGAGPMGFQPDVFDSAPDEPSYSPLRILRFVTWRERASERILRSASDIETAATKGEIRIERSRIVVNMPFVSWPGGRR